MMYGMFFFFTARLFRQQETGESCQRRLLKANNKYFTRVLLLEYTFY